MNKREIGFYCESAAVSYLKNKGFEIIEKNFRYGRFAEIDIIALKNSVLHIIEVKRAQINILEDLPKQLIIKNNEYQKLHNII